MGLTGLAIQPAMAFLPSWSDLFPSLRPFQDPSEESVDDMGLDEGSARLGFVQVRVESCEVSQLCFLSLVSWRINGFVL